MHQFPGTPLICGAGMVAGGELAAFQMEIRVFHRGFNSAHFRVSGSKTLPQMKRELTLLSEWTSLLNEAFLLSRLLQC